MILKSEIEAAVKRQVNVLKKKKDSLQRSKLGEIELSPNYIVIITGIRRCGKSTLMYQLAEKEDQSKSWFNFEDSRVFGFEVSDFHKLREVFNEKNTHYYFDEIQNVESWEVFIRELHEEENTICITGSNASMLSKELGTKLTGRNIQIELFPFSYKEYCSFRKLERNPKSYASYLEEGGFPDYLKNKQKEYLQQLFRDIIYRDIIVRYGIRNAKVMIEIALFLISNSAKEYSLNNIRKAFGVGSTNSVANYVQWLEDAYMLFSIPRFSWSLKSVSVNPKKVYTVDTGFANANSLSFTNDVGRLFENSIFLELRRNHKEIYYFREKGECDFIVKQGKEILHVLQVCVEVTPDNLNREVNGLVEALVFFDKPDGVIVTLSQDDVLEKNGKTIHLVSAYKWLKNGLL